MKHYLLAVCVFFSINGVSAYAAEKPFTCPRDNSMLVIKLVREHATELVGLGGDTVYLDGNAAVSGDRIVDITMKHGKFKICETTAAPGELPPLKIVLQSSVLKP